MKDILKILGVEKLDESQQDSIKEKLEGVIDVKARERATTLVEEKKEELVTEYEEKFEDYKKDITSKFSNFVDSVIDEELEIPERVIEFARKGELYTDLIEQFKVKLSLDEGILDDEIKSLLKESKEEILNLRESVNGLTKKEIDLQEDAKKMATHIYLRTKCDGLTESNRQKVISLLEDVEDKKEIDKKFDYIVETILSEKKKVDDDDKDGEEEESFSYECPKCGEKFELTEKKEEVKCPECGETFKVKVSEEDDKKDEGKGKIDVNNKTKIDEDKSPFKTQQNEWVKILQEGKF